MDERGRRTPSSARTVAPRPRGRHLERVGRVARRAGWRRAFRARLPRGALPDEVLAALRRVRRGRRGAASQQRGRRRAAAGRAARLLDGRRGCRPGRRRPAVSTCSASRRGCRRSSTSRRSPAAGSRSSTAGSTRGLPGVPGVRPSVSQGGFDRALAAGADVERTVIPGAVHAIALRSPRGRLVPMPRARPLGRARRRRAGALLRARPLSGAADPVVRTLARLLYRVEIVGPPCRREPSILASNHESVLDPLSARRSSTRQPLRFLAKAELWRFRPRGGARGALGGHARRSWPRRSGRARALARAARDGLARRASSPRASSADGIGGTAARPGSRSRPARRSCPCSSTARAARSRVAASASRASALVVGEPIPVEAAKPTIAAARELTETLRLAVSTGCADVNASGAFAPSGDTESASLAVAAIVLVERSRSCRHVADGRTRRDTRLEYIVVLRDVVLDSVPACRPRSSRWAPRRPRWLVCEHAARSASCSAFRRRHRAPGGAGHASPASRRMPRVDGARDAAAVTWGVDRIDQRHRPLSSSFTYRPRASADRLHRRHRDPLSHERVRGRAASARRVRRQLLATAAVSASRRWHVGWRPTASRRTSALVAVRVLHCSGSGSTARCHRRRRLGDGATSSPARPPSRT